MRMGGCTACVDVPGLVVATTATEWRGGEGRETSQAELVPCTVGARSREGSKIIARHSIAVCFGQAVLQGIFFGGGGVRNRRAVLGGQEKHRPSPAVDM